jgi:hypothetical protein
MWSKVFSLHQDVYGWQELNKTYWIGHDREPFNEYWRDPAKLKEFNWQQSDYYITSISVPYMENGNATVPNFKEFVDQLTKLNIRVIIGIIGRDKNILSMQESRLRGGETYQTAIDCYSELPADSIHFLSHELLILYRGLYLKSLSRNLKFPINLESKELSIILSDNANEKYLRPVNSHWVDDLAKNSSRKWK